MRSPGGFGGRDQPHQPDPEPLLLPPTCSVLCPQALGPDGPPPLQMLWREGQRARASSARRPLLTPAADRAINQRGKCQKEKKKGSAVMFPQAGE